MKKIIALLAILMLLSLIACGKNDTSRKDSADTPNDTVLTEDEPGKAEEEPIDVPKKEKPKEMSAEELETEIQKQPCFVTECEYYVQDNQYKALYPDLMIAKLMNQSGTAIKNAVVAFAAWDENNLPVLIDTIGNGEYVVHCSMNGINLADGETMTDAGMQVDSQQAERGEIKSFKAIVVSYEDFDGNTWRNPLYDNWVKLYREQALR